MSVAFQRTVGALRAARVKKSQLLARQAVVNAQLGALFADIAKLETKLEKFTGLPIDDDVDLSDLEIKEGTAS